MRLLLRLLAAAAALTAVGCHDARRGNPFDPELTPAIGPVAVTVDSTAGAAQVNWAPYGGDQPFAAYRVLRKIKGFEAWDLRVEIDDPGRTSAVDTGLAADVDYLYRVDVVNRGGYTAAGAEVAAAVFSLVAPQLESAQADPLTGTVALRWGPFAGPGFVGYEVWRRSFGQEAEMLYATDDLDAVAWTDPDPLPATDYIYRLNTLTADRTLESLPVEVVYRLPEIELVELQLGSDTAAARLRWTPYRGPRFAAYEVRRSQPELSELTVAVIGEAEATSYVDSALDGNTEYTYRVFVRTTWAGGIGVSSTPRAASFYRLEEFFELPAVANAEAQALALAFDEADRLYIASTQILTTTARTMLPGVRVLFPEDGGYRTYFNEDEFTPDPRSILQVAVADDWTYVAVGLEDGRVLAGAIDPERAEAWGVALDLGGERPAGFYRVEPGDIGAAPDGAMALIDSRGVMHYLGPDGAVVFTTAQLNVTLESDLVLPLRHIVVGRDAWVQGNDAFFLLAPERSQNHLLGRTMINTAIPLIGGKIDLGDGVGPGNGETLNPLLIAFDAFNQRLVVLEELGRLQVLDARPDAQRDTGGALSAPRYITKWGRFGRGAGAFVVSPPTVAGLAVDGRGRIFVADGEGDAGRVQVFAP